MTETGLGLLAVLINVIIISLIIATPILILIGLMHIYDRYKKGKNKEQKEAQRIIIKNNEAIVKTTSSIKILDEQFRELDYKVLKLKEQKLELEKDLGLVESVEPEDEIIDAIDYKNKTIKELQDLAREMKIKGFSRMKKEKLINILETRTIV